MLQSWCRGLLPRDLSRVYLRQTWAFQFQPLYHSEALHRCSSSKSHHEVIASFKNSRKFKFEVIFLQVRCAEFIDGVVATNLEDTPLLSFDKILLAKSKGDSALITLYGYICERSDLSKKLSFVYLRDASQAYQIQLVSAPNRDNPLESEVHERLKSIRNGTPLLVRGRLKSREQASNKSKSSALAVDRGVQESLDILEVSITGPDCKVESLNDFPSDIVLKEHTVFPPEQRHLQLRNNSDLRQALSLRATIQSHCRQFLSADKRLTEIETPVLFKSTSEGAREFLVPTRREGYAYALPQSPQQFKQILMASGIDGYFQFAKCFRDEDLRADRQPEFAQLDMELAFASGGDVMATVERLLVELWRRLDIGESSKDTQLSFKRLSYENAMLQYGSDKPDLRMPMQPFASVAHLIPADLTSKITPLADPVVEAMIVPLQCTTKQSVALVSEYLESPEGNQHNANPDGGPGVFVYDFQKPLQGLSALGFEAAETFERDFELEEGHLIILQARKKGSLTGSSTALGNLRTGIFNAAVKKGYLPAPNWDHFEALWITDFPLFSPPDPSEPGQGGHAGFASTHHPFTSPKTPEDVDLLLSDPTKVIGDHYDLVINGEEIAGGSRRIHQAGMQEFVFRNILKMDEAKVEEFRHLLDALRAGCPPHAGIAFGFDRLVAMLVSSKLKKQMSMRDVIAFPKSGKGEDQMMKSPGPLSNEALEMYHLKLRA